VSEPTAELLRRGLHALRRSTMWWGLGIVALTIVSVAFWPSLEGTKALTDMVESSKELMEAFGAQNLATASGYLDGQLYALMLPLLLSGFAIAVVTALTSGDEDAGRLELLEALPVPRTTVWLTRLAAVVVGVGAIALVTAVVVSASISPFSLDGVTVGRIFVATFACAALALFHAAVAYAVGGAGGSRGLSVGTSIAVLVAGYVASYLLPLSDALTGFRKLSPWYWAIGNQPVTEGLPGAWIVLLLGVTAALVAFGTAAVTRRDVRSA
jgi:ABC-2 type transport system permease protein